VLQRERAAANTSLFGRPAESPMAAAGSHDVLAAFPRGTREHGSHVLSAFRRRQIVVHSPSLSLAALQCATCAPAASVASPANTLSLPPRLLVRFCAITASLTARGECQPLLPASTTTAVMMIASRTLRLPLVQAAGRALRAALKYWAGGDANKDDGLLPLGLVCLPPISLWPSDDATAIDLPAAACPSSVPRRRGQPIVTCFQGHDGLPVVDACGPTSSARLCLHGQSDGWAYLLGLP
jgi:hypothetical protein